MHHAHAVGQRIQRGVDPDRLSVDADLPFVRLEQSIENVHQSRLSGAVFPQQHVDLAPLELEAGPVVGQDPGETLCDILHFKDVAHNFPPLSEA